MVTSAIFAPHPDLIVPQEAGADKPDSDCKSDNTDDSETIPSGTDQNCSHNSALCMFAVFSFSLSSVHLCHITLSQER